MPGELPQQVETALKQITDKRLTNYLEMVRVLKPLRSGQESVLQVLERVLSERVVNIIGPPPSPGEIAASERLQQFCNALAAVQQDNELPLACLQRLVAERDGEYEECEPRTPAQSCLSLTALDEFWTAALHELAPYAEQPAEPLIDTLRSVVARLNSCLNALNRLSVDPSIQAVLVRLEAAADVWSAADAVNDPVGRKEAGAKLLGVCRELRVAKGAT
jgi:hypothetical protein